MAFELSAVIGGGPTVTELGDSLQSPVVALDQSFALLPWTSRDQAGPRGVAAPSELVMFEYLDDELLQGLTRISHQGPVAYVEAEFFGGQGEQSAAVLHRGAVQWVRQGGGEWPGSPISQALRQIGVVAAGGKDEFDTLGLGRHRRTHDWLSEGCH